MGLLEDTKNQQFVKEMETQLHQLPSVRSDLKTSVPGCPQCGMSHPPIKPGERCPNAPIEVEGKKVDLTKFFVDLKNILISQIEQRDVKDIDRLCKNITIEIAKFLEKYEE